MSAAKGTKPWNAGKGNGWTDTRKNPAAVALGKLAKGKPKNFSKAELDRRRERLVLARAKRWPKKGKPAPSHQSASP